LDGGINKDQILPWCRRAVTATVIAVPAPVEDMTGETAEEPQDAPPGPPQKMGPAFYGALALVGFLVLMVVFLNYPAAKASAGMQMTKTTWALQSYTDNTGIFIPALSGAGVSARFGSDGTLAGSAGCNHYSAGYSTKDYSLTISDVTSTLMFCQDPGVMEQESAFLADLPKAASFRVDESSLRVYDSAGKPLLVFIPS
jgi:heat shock protein HslJ